MFDKHDNIPHVQAYVAPDPYGAPVESSPYVHQPQAVIDGVDVLANPLNEAGAREYLHAKKWPNGLIDTTISSMKKM